MLHIVAVAFCRVALCRTSLHNIIQNITTRKYRISFSIIIDDMHILIDNPVIHCVANELTDSVRCFTCMCL